MLSKTVCVTQDISVATSWTVDLSSKVTFTPDRVIVRAYVLNANATAVAAQVWSDIINDIIFSVGANATVVSQQLELTYDVKRPITTVSFALRKDAGAALATVAGGALFFHIEFQKDK